MRNANDSGSRLSFLNVKFGLFALLAYLSFGLLLEAMHGFKIPWYLDHETRRLMWTLAHAHGVLLAVLVIGFGMMLRVTDTEAEGWPRIASACLIGATVLLPGGFALGGIFLFGQDPGPGVILSPIGGALLFAGVGITAFKYRA